LVDLNKREEKMKNPSIQLVMQALILSILSGYAGAAPARVPIVVGSEATAVEKLAGQELADHLQRLYPDHLFPVVTSQSNNGRCILLGTAKSQPQLVRYVPEARLRTPESFVVTTAKEGNADIGVIAGADPRGTLYGVYALLEKLGYGFYLSYNTEPAPPPSPFRFEGWNLADAPLFPDRAALPWHNFLSGPSAWNLQDWQHWSTQLARMGYNTAMVHGYGNNPMFTFTFRGRTKPVGYLPSTAKGRDWGTEHSNDVRRLIGGDLLGGEVFGSSAALVSDEERVKATITLMQQAFAFAQSRGLHVAYVLDIDTESANPQEILRELPASARLTSGADFQLANPDTPEGYEYYRTEAAALLGLYPQIDRLVLFFRQNPTPWRNIPLENFPQSWKAAYAQALENNPSLRDDKDALSTFAISHVIAAYQRALRELGRTDVQLEASSWNGLGTWFVPSADYFFPREIPLIVMDQSEMIEVEGAGRILQGVGAHRKVYPIFWATHDDRTYLVRSHTPFADFSSFLHARNCTGFGVIHWTTRPVDLYFKSLGAQVWGRTENQPLAATCARMAADTFGESARETGGQYLLKWITEAPVFGRETTDRFMDLVLKDAAVALSRCHERLDLLAKIDRSQLPDAGSKWLDYYNNLERFVIGFFESHTAFDEAQALREEGRLDKAQQTIARSKPESVIEQFIRMSSIPGLTRGDQGLIVSLNLRWRPYIASERQAEGLEPMRLKFEPTFQEALAQQPGVNTFYFDSARQIWKGLGENETGRPAFAEPPGTTTDEICRTGVQIDRRMSFRLGPIMGDKLVPGTYTAHLLFAPRPAFADIALWGSPVRQPARERVEIHSGSTHPVEITRTLEVTDGSMEVTIIPVFGTVYACGAILEPTPGTSPIS
jgi:hypothetical protein